MWIRPMRKLILIIGVMLVMSGQNAHAATQLKKYVVGGSTAGGTGNTNATTGADRGYASLEECMNANEQNLVTADKYFDVEIDGTWSSADTSAVTIHNYTTDATRYINIYTTATARHLGKVTANAYQLQGVITIIVNYLTINGLDVVGQIVGGTTWINDVTIKNCLVHDHSGNLISMSAGASNWIIYNCILYNNSGTWVSGILMSDTGGGVHNYVYNCTISNVRYYGILGDGGAGISDVYNCWVGNAAQQGSGGAFLQIDNGGNNASDDATADDVGTGCLINQTTANQFVNIGAGVEDFHLKAGASLIDAGADESGIFTTDIDGVTRSGTWDIGADEYVAAVADYTGFIAISEE